MNYKARDFSEFAVDNYDYNVFSDDDLEYLWDWVEMDDFSDVAEASQETSSQASFGKPSARHQGQGDDGGGGSPPAGVDHFSQDMSASSPPSMPSALSPSQNGGGTQDFDFSNDAGGLDDFKPTTDLSQFGIELPSAGSGNHSLKTAPSETISDFRQPSSAPSAAAPMSMAQTPDFSSPFDDGDDDFDFDFDFDIDDDLSASPPSFQSGTGSLAPPQPASFQKSFDTQEDDDEDSDSHHQGNSDQGKDQGQDSESSSSPDTLEGDDFDFDFDFDFDDSEDMIEKDFSFSEPEIAQVHKDDFDFNFNDDTHNTIGTGGFSTQNSTQNISAPASVSAAPPRIIKTPAGTLNIDTDDILAHLQQLEFDDFIDVLKKNNHVYDLLMARDDWSEDELDFLTSLEEMVRIAPKPIPATVMGGSGQGGGQAHASPANNSATHHSQNHSPQPILTKTAEELDTRTCKDADSLKKVLMEKTSAIAAGNTGQKKYIPENLHEQWIQENPQETASRVGNILGKNIPFQERGIGIPAHAQLPFKSSQDFIFNAKNKTYFEELIEIIEFECEQTKKQVPPEAIGMITESGFRFGLQFNQYLLDKYGTKILFLYQSQMKQDLLADIMFEHFIKIFAKYFTQIDNDDFTRDFFKGVIEMLQKYDIPF